MQKIARLKKAMKESRRLRIYEDLYQKEALNPTEMLKKLGGVARGSESKPLLSGGGLDSFHENSLSSVNAPAQPQDFFMGTVHGAVAPKFTGSDLDLHSHSPEHLDAAAAPEHPGSSDTQLGGQAPDWNQEAEKSAQAAQTAQSQGHWQQAAQDWYMAGHDYNQAGRYNEAAEAYINSANNFGNIVNNRDGGHGTEALYAEIARSNNHAGDCYSAAGKFSEAAQCYENAAANFSDIVNICGDHSGDAFVDIAQSYMFAGGAYQQAGHYNEAVTAFSNAAANFVGVEAYAGAAQAYLAEAQANVQGHYGWQTPVNFQNAAHYFRLAGETNQAAEAYAQAAQYYNNEGSHSSEVGHCARLAGELFLENGNFTDAISNLNLAINQYSGNEQRLGEIYNDLGKAYMGLGKYSEAAQQFVDAASDFSNLINSQSPTPEQWLELAKAYEDAGKAYAKAGNSEQAAVNFQNSICNFQNAGDNEAALTYAREAAQDYLSLAQSQSKDISADLQNAYNCFAKVGDWQNGMTLLENTARELQAQHPRQAAYALGFAAQSAGNAGNSVQEYNCYMESGKLYVAAAMTEDFSNSGQGQGDLNAANDAFNNVLNNDLVSAADINTFYREVSAQFLQAATFFAGQPNGGQSQRAILANQLYSQWSN